MRYWASSDCGSRGSHPLASSLDSPFAPRKDVGLARREADAGPCCRPTTFNLLLITMTVAAIILTRSVSEGLPRKLADASGCVLADVDANLCAIRV